MIVNKLRPSSARFIMHRPPSTPCEILCAILQPETASAPRSPQPPDSSLHRCVTLHYSPLNLSPSLSLSLCSFTTVVFPIVLFPISCSAPSLRSSCSSTTPRLLRRNSSLGETSAPTSCPCSCATPSACSFAA